MMTARLNPYEQNLALVQPLIDYGNKVAGMGLEKSLVDLVKIRASQINGCAGVPVYAHRGGAEVGREPDAASHAGRLA
jgi:hypothetical protein